MDVDSLSTADGGRVMGAERHDPSAEAAASARDVRICSIVRALFDASGRLLPRASAVLDAPLQELDLLRICAAHRSSVACMDACVLLFRYETRGKLAQC